MRLVPIKLLKENAKLALSLTDRHGRTLISAKQVVNARALDVLKNSGLEFIYVEDQYCFDIRDELDEDGHLAEDFSTRDVTRYADPIDNLKVLFKNFPVYNVTDTQMRHLFTFVKSIINEIIRAKGKYRIICEPIKRQPDLLYETAIYTTYACIIMGIQMDLSRTSLVNLGLASMLKDTGLFCDELDLSKEEDYEAHPLWSYKYLKRNGIVPDPALAIILQHHEKEDGTGYPRQLEGKNIDPSAKIIGLVNAYYDLKAKYDANFESSYLTFETDLNALLSEFDLDVGRIFMDNLEIFPLDTIVKLDNNDFGVVVRNVKTNPFHPYIKIIKSKEYSVGQIVGLKDGNNLSIKHIIYLS